jgi:hypothetical protein
MLYLAIFVIIIIILLSCNTSQKENYKGTEGKPVYMYNDAHKYLYDYDHIFGGFPFWYNRTTPLPFNNPTRFYGYNYYYPAIHDYYYPRIRYY